MSKPSLFGRGSVGEPPCTDETGNEKNTIMITSKQFEQKYGFRPFMQYGWDLEIYVLRPEYGTTTRVQNTDDVISDLPLLTYSYRDRKRLRTDHPWENAELRLGFIPSAKKIQSCAMIYNYGGGRSLVPIESEESGIKIEGGIKRVRQANEVDANPFQCKGVWSYKGIRIYPRPLSDDREIAALEEMIEEDEIWLGEKRVTDTEARRHKRIMREKAKDAERESWQSSKFGHLNR